MVDLEWVRRGEVGRHVQEAGDKPVGGVVYVDGDGLDGGFLVGGGGETVEVGWLLD